MMSKDEMKALVASLKKIYTDVRLISEEELLEEGLPIRKPCSVCEHKGEPLRCAARVAMATRSTQCRLEQLDGDVAHITCSYQEVDGKPYVLELVQRTPAQNIVDSAEGESIVLRAAGWSSRFYRDGLTGAYNRLYYEDVARTVVGPAGIAVIDMDDFRVYNDTYGHHAGDVALEVTAEAIRSCIRRDDVLIRYGGDEFLLVLVGIPGDYLKTKLEQIRAKVQEAVIPGYPHLHPSVSIGGAVQSLSEPMEKAVFHAENLLCRAKNRKNTVVTDSAEKAASSEKSQEITRPQLLIVDDSGMNRAILTEILGTDYRILEAENGKVCLEQIQQHRGDIAIVLLDINMPVMDGYEVLRAMNADHSIEDLPVIMISSEDTDDAVRRAYELGASDYISRPFDAKLVYRRVFNTIKLYAKQRHLVQLVSAQIRAREKNTAMLVGVLSQIVEFRNGESGSHVRHIRIITELLLERLLERTKEYAIAPEEQEDIPLASALHDIGKIAIDEKILNKPGRLTPEEFDVIKTHSTQGADMLHNLENFEEEPLLLTAYEIARWHHERWDGRGYPDGLRGNDIPISAQIVSLADVYDALTSERCYKKAFTHEKAIQMIMGGECGAFNPLLLQCLLDIQSDLKQEMAAGK